MRSYVGDLRVAQVKAGLFHRKATEELAAVEERVRKYWCAPLARCTARWLPTAFYSDLSQDMALPPPFCGTRGCMRGPMAHYCVAHCVNVSPRVMTLAGLDVTTLVPALRTLSVFQEQLVMACPTLCYTTVLGSQVLDD
jgi:hypothetical protein